MRKGNKFFLKSPRPSLPLKRAPPLTPTLSPSGEREETALLGARNRYALRLADHQRSRQIVRDGTAWLLRGRPNAASKPSPYFAGWDRMGMTGYSLYPGNLLITCRFLVVFLMVSRKKRNFGGKLYKLNNSSFACKLHTPWARSFWAFSPYLNHMRKFSPFNLIHLIILKKT